MLGRGRIGRALAERIADDLRREVTIDSLLEQLPDPSNRVLLDPSRRDPIGLPRPKLVYSIDAYTHAGGDFAFELSRAILVAMGADRHAVKATATYAGAGHLLGTHRMGDDPNTSVTDSFGRCHDHPDLRLLGGGSFPTIGTANPSLTVVALALRSAEQMIAELRGGAT
jgi:choline dehydrogenase-like flavoprotein